MQDCLSGETNCEKSRRVQDQHPGQGSLSGESDADEKVSDEKQDLENKVLSGEFRWMRRRHRTDPEKGTGSIADSSMDRHLLRQELECNIRLLQSHMRLKKNRPYNHWLKGQGHYLLCFPTSRTVGASSVRL